MRVKVIESTSDDVDIILSLIRLLAESDGVKNVSIGKDALLTNIYSEQPIAFAKLILCDEIIAGFIIHSWKFATFLGTREMYMQAIYIKPEFRRGGVATKALGQLSKIALEAGCSRLEWYVVKNNSMSNGFYDALGADTLSHARVRRFSEAAMKRLVERENSQVLPV